MSNRHNPSRKRTGISWAVTGVLLGLIAIVLWWRGHDFYPLAIDDRPDHPEYRELKSSGTLGYGYGVAGTLLIFTNLLYLARRRFASWNLGAMKLWLDLHVFTGLAAAVFVSFHATFLTRTPLARITTLSLLFVVVTGLAGRFLYALVPRIQNTGLTDAVAELEGHLPHVAARIREFLDQAEWLRRGRLSLWQMPAAALRQRRVTASLSRKIRRCMTDPSAATRASAEVASIHRRIQRELRRKSRSVLAAAILRTWRGVHLFFAILMLLSVISHIGTAWYYGYRWIWSG